MNAVVRTETQLSEIQEPKSANDGILAVIARAASDPACDVDKLDRMLAMHERVMAKQAEQAFNEAMTKAQGEIGRVVANKENAQTHSRYADEAAIDRIARPVYTKNGFSLSFNTGKADSPDCIKVICYCAHSAGHTRSYEIDMPADGKGARGGDVMTKTHATGSGTQYGKRYLLKLIFNIVIGNDDDGNGAGIQYVSEDQGKEVNTLIEEAGETIRAPFLKYMGGKEPLPTVMHILAKDYDKAVKKLKEKIAEKSK